MTRSTQLSYFSKVIGKGSFRSILKVAAVSVIALTAAMASARAEGQITEITGDFSEILSIYGNHDGVAWDSVRSAADTSGNTLTFSTGARTNDNVNVYGGWADSTTSDINANSNKINIDAFVNDGIGITIGINGGYSKGGNAEGNEIMITGGTFNNGDYIRGGSVAATAADQELSAAGNTVTINDGTFNGAFEIMGAYTNSGIGNGNVTLNVTGNAVTVTKGDFSTGSLMSSKKISIIGGKAYLDNNSYNSSAAVTGNAVTVEGGTFATVGSPDTLKIIGGEISDGYEMPIADSSIANNTVKVTGGSFKIDTYIYGGYTDIGDADEITVADNEVYVSGGTFDKYTMIAGGYHRGDGKVTGNKVYVSGGTFDKYVEIIGGCGHGWYDSEVSGNEVHLSGGTFTGNDNMVVAGVSNGEGAVKNNTVYVSGDVDLSNVDVIAATKSDDDAIKSGGGNTLVFGKDGRPWNSANNNKIDMIMGFDTVKITAAIWKKPITAVYFDTTYAQNGKTAVDATKVAFAGIDSVKKGDKTELFVAQELSAGSELTLKSAKSTYTIGTTLQGDGTVALDSVGTVTYEIDNAENRSAQPQAHTAAMASAAKMTALKQGADTAASALSNLSGSGKTGMQGFAAVGGGTARQETGSHLTLNAVNFTAGMGGTFAAGAAKLTVGGALEAGHGSFKNHFDAGDADPYINKKGHVNYYGGAVLSEMRWAGDWHANANLRAGYAKTEQTAALYNAGTNTAYDIDSGAYYVGTEIGGGKVLGLTDNQSVDLYGKYIYLHQGGDSFEAGGHYDVKGVDSHRLKAGARYDHGFNKTWGLYAGLAGEYEFDGKGRVMADGAEVLPAKTKGMRGIGELGVKLTPEESGFSMDVNVKGSVGKYRSALFGIDVRYEF